MNAGRRWVPRFKDKEAALPKIELFFKDRFKALLVDRGYREDLVEAAVASDFERPMKLRFAFTLLPSFGVTTGLSEPPKWLNGLSIY